MTLTSEHLQPSASERNRTPLELRVAHFPHEYGEDPASYLGLLRAALQRKGVSVVAAGRLTPRWVARQAMIDVVHLHWLEFIVQSDPRPIAGMVRTAARAGRLIAALLQLRRRGVAIAWTVHNLGPHEPVRPRLEYTLGKAVMRLSDSVIVHSDYARRRVEERFGHGDKLVVVPHGNYFGVFPDDPRERAEIRRALGLPRHAFVFLAFGQVRPYKRLVELVSAFSELSGDDVRLVVAGEPTSPAEAARLKAAALRDERVILDLRRIPDDEISTLHRAADAAALAYEEVFSSGALLLALSYGLPVVAPAQGTAGEVVQPPGIESFAPGALASALDRMRQGDHAARTRAATEAAELCSWDRVGSAIAGLYCSASAQLPRRQTA
jgi:beta-1,4-mannosyltransferase